MSNEEMIKNSELDVSVIPLAETLARGRIDSEYYRQEFLKLQQHLTAKASKPLSEVAAVDGGKRLPIGEQFDEEGVPYVRVVDIRGYFVDYSNVNKISEKLYQGLKRYQIKHKDILLTIVGNTIGLTGFNQEDYEKCNFTENCARIRAKTVSPEFLFVVLTSSIGQKQVQRERVGTAQPKLALERLRNFLIPTPSKRLEGEMIRAVVEAQRIIRESKMCFVEANRILLQELGIADIKQTEKNISIRSLVEAAQANRFDAEYWQPKYDEVEASIKAAHHATFGDIFTWKKGIEVGSEAYQEQGVPFIRISNLTAQEITDNDQKCISPELYAELKDDYAPRKDEILFSKDGTVGIAHHLTDHVEGIISGGILRLNVKGKNIDPDYLTVCLNSLAIQMQVERYGGGSIIQHLKTDDAEKILIPLLNTTQQKAIAEGARIAREKLTEAKALIDLAKRAVEAFIEKDENAAFKIISRGRSPSLANR